MIHLFLAGFLSLMLSQPSLAQEREFSIYQGVVSSTEGIPRYIIIDERAFPLAGDVKVKDHKERDARLSDLKAGKWVYIVSEFTPDGPEVKKIYLLPEYIKKSEKDNYPFMKREEDPEK